MHTTTAVVLASGHQSLSWLVNAVVLPVLATTSVDCRPANASEGSVRGESRGGPAVCVVRPGPSPASRALKLI